MEKRAVLLLNLGSPKSTEVSDVREYLDEFLSDERVIDSGFARKVILPLIILPTRPKQSAEAYSRVWTQEGSPLLVTSLSQQKLVQEQQDIPIELAMRYGSPSIADVIGKLKKDGINKLFVMPLYPHYAMSSYETVVVKVTEEIARQAPEMQFDILQPFYNEPNYIQALVDSAQPYLDAGYDHLLFSYHGIPERHLRVSDASNAHCLSVQNCCDVCSPVQSTCYRHQCFQTTAEFVKMAKIPKEKYTVSFQSRLGREPWLQPYTDKMLEDLPEKGIKKLLVMCPAFVTDCLETLEEISMEGKESFIEAGGSEFTQIPCLNEHSSWITFLNDKINSWRQTPVATV